MVALATVDDVEFYLGRALTDEERARIDGQLAIASSLVRQTTGRLFTPGQHTVTRLVRDGRVTLPESPVASVQSVRQVVSDGTETLIDSAVYVLRGNVLYGLGSFCAVEIAYTTTASVPEEIVAIVAGMVATLFSGPVQGVEQETAGPFSVRFREGSGQVQLGPYGALLARYRAPAQPIDLLR